MSLQHHTITVGGTTKTLAQWGITSCVVTHRLGGEDTMQLTITRNVDESAIFAGLAVLTLRDPGGVIRFQGRVLRPPRIARQGSETHSYTVVGPWKYLQEVTYQQASHFADNPDEILVTLVPEEIARVILHRDPATGEKWNMRQQVEDALQYAVDAGAPIAFAVTDISGAMGVPTIEPPEDQALDQRVADVVRRSLGWAPHIGCRWDYSGGTPTLRFGDTVTGSEWGTRTAALSDLSDWQGEERYDLLCPAFEICYIEENLVEEDGKRVKWLKTHRDTSTVANGAFGKQVSTVVLRGYVWDGSQWTDKEPRPADGLAASLHKAFKQLFYDMSWEMPGQEVDWTPQPGELWNITGVNAGFASAQSVAQEIVRDLGAGTTAIQAGPPTFLGLADRLALLVPNRIRGLSRSSGESTYGMAPPDAREDTQGMTTVRLSATQQVDGSCNAVILDVMARVVPPEEA